MKVSMDGLRSNLINSYNALCKTMNRSIKNGEFNPDRTFCPDDIQEDMDDIRNCIVTLAFCYSEGDDGFKELENVSVESFNEEPE